jgi:hypothetical protein
MRRAAGSRASAAATIAFTLVLSGAAPAIGAAQGLPPPPAPPAAAPGAEGTTTFAVENTTRAEVWRYFDPPPGGAPTPDYTFFGNRAALGTTYEGPRWRLAGALQYVRVENLPAGSIGPGLLGTGAAYYFQAAGGFSYQFYLRHLSVRWQSQSRRAWLEAGRFSRAVDLAASGDADVDALARADLGGRLLGDMEWSFYQRAWDGVRGGGSRGGVAAAFMAAVPTQGTYEESANLFMDRVKVAAVEASIAPGRLVRHTRMDAFATSYDDTRPVTSRPDNTAGLAARADVHVRTVGAAAVGSYPTAWGRAEVVAWAAAQGGRWFEQRHRAWAMTTTAGHRFASAPWRPRLRTGVVYASGDGRPFDDTHGTFFAMLPSGDRVSALNAYALMNVRDVWGAIDAAPGTSLDIEVGVRRVHLAQLLDRWYQGSGATARSGPYFGFQGRRSSGSRDLGTIVEGRVSWRPRTWWTLRAYLGRMRGGDVVGGLFRGDRLLSGWLESAVRF